MELISVPRRRVCGSFEAPMPPGSGGAAAPGELIATPAGGKDQLISIERPRGRYIDWYRASDEI
jgi:hypothetical protein